MTMRCIYCLRDLSDSDFSTEHVLQQSLGKFRNNLTLPDLVCADCNNYFGRTIDLMLGRGSMEAVLRLNYGVQPPEKVRHLRRNRVRFTWNTDGDWAGLILERVVESGRLVVRPIPQVGFAKTTGTGLMYVSEEILADNSLPLPDRIDPQRPPFIVANSEETRGRLVHLLETRGITFKPGREILWPAKGAQTLSVKVEGRIDTSILRCVAKIAFNYLAWIAGRDLLIEPAFCPTRRFIRYEENPGYPVVVVDEQPILIEDLPRKRQTIGHLVTVDWTIDQRSIFSQVSLFNHARYRII
jgi:hypothetical protein